MSSDYKRSERDQRLGWPLHDDSGIVSGALLEEQLELIRARVTSPLAGVFGPSSMTWRMNRESILFLAAGRALRLQLAHPWVAAAVADHSKALTDPVARFHRTFRVVFRMVFGTVDQAFAAARSLHRRHGSITGVLPEAVGPFEARVGVLREQHFAIIDGAKIDLRPIAAVKSERRPSTVSMGRSRRLRANFPENLVEQS